MQRESQDLLGDLDIFLSLQIYDTFNIVFCISFLDLTGGTINFHTQGTSTQASIAGQSSSNFPGSPLVSDGNYLYLVHTR